MTWSTNRQPFAQSISPRCSEPEDVGKAVQSASCEQKLIGRSAGQAQCGGYLVADVLGQAWPVQFTGLGLAAAGQGHQRGRLASLSPGSEPLPGAQHADERGLAKLGAILVGRGSEPGQIRTRWQAVMCAACAEANAAGCRPGIVVGEASRLGLHRSG